MRTLAIAALLVVFSLGSPHLVAAVDETAGGLSKEPSTPLAVAGLPAEADPICVQAMAMAAFDDARGMTTQLVLGDAGLDEAIRTCGSLLDWTVAALLQPDVLADVDPLWHLLTRCADADAGLDVTATCRSLEATLAGTAFGTPPGQASAIETASVAQPEPVPTQPPSTGSTSTGRIGSLGTRKIGADGRVRLPATLRVDVPGASEVRYFDVAGRSARALVRQTLKRAAPHCGVHNALACVDLAWRVETTHSDASGRCTVVDATAAVTSTVFLPRWSRPARVDRRLLRWWRTVLTASARHEATHIRILESELARLRKQLIGRPCSSTERLIERARKRSNKAQAAFDRREAARPLPAAP